MTKNLIERNLGLKIYIVRGNQVMLDNDLALLYEIETFNLNKAVKRHPDFFPEDFMYRLTSDEQNALKFQNGMSKKLGRGGRRNLPYGFTQEGVAMLATVLKNKRAAQVNIAILRAFAKLRKDADAILRLSERVTRIEARLDNESSSAEVELIQLDRKIQEVKLPTFIPPNLVSSPIYVQNPTHSARILIIEEIQKAVSQYYGVTPSDLKSPKRTPAIAFPRQVCMYLIRKYTGYNYKRIGELFSRKDHTTVLHACKKIEILVLEDQGTAVALKYIEANLERPRI